MENLAQRLSIRNQSSNREVNPCKVKRLKNQSLNREGREEREERPFWLARRAKKTFLAVFLCGLCDLE
jgi:hypothetical protein